MNINILLLTAVSTRAPTENVNTNTSLYVDLLTNITPQGSCSRPCYSIAASRTGVNTGVFYRLTDLISLFQW